MLSSAGSARNCAYNNFFGEYFFIFIGNKIYNLCNKIFTYLVIISSMEKHGLKCPDDISIIGIDNIKIASYYNISLSSINTNVEEISKLVTKMLFKKIENHNFGIIQSVSVKSNLIIRNSIKNLNETE